MINPGELNEWWGKTNNRFIELGDKPFITYPRAAYDYGIIALNFIALGTAAILSIASDVRTIREKIEKGVS